MTRHYLPREFFRNTPNALLARYFAAREVLQDFDFVAIKETRIGPLFEAWLAMPDSESRSHAGQPPYCRREMPTDLDNEARDSKPSTWPN